MALYSASVKPVSRSSGRSATAAAAYRNAERITDERTGEIHDYTRRSGVDHVEAFAPHGMAAQASAELWNKAEAAEVRKNARVAREVLVALPHELDQVQRRELAKSIAQDLADRYGTAGTLAVHYPDREGDNRNYHAHILMTTRRLDAFGQLGEKTRELDDVKRGPEEVEWIRAMIEAQTNRSLERAGAEGRVDRRSLVEQRAAALDAGDIDRAAHLDRPATIHEGPRVTQIRRESARAGRAPLGALDRAAANDQSRQLAADRTELRQVADVINMAEYKAKKEAEEAKPKLGWRDRIKRMGADLTPEETAKARAYFGSSTPVRSDQKKAESPVSKGPDPLLGSEVQSKKRSEIQRNPGESRLDAQIRMMKEKAELIERNPDNPFLVLLSKRPRKFLDEGIQPEPKATVPKSEPPSILEAEQKTPENKQPSPLPQRFSRDLPSQSSLESPDWGPESFDGPDMDF